MSKTIKMGIGLLLLGFVLYNSVFFRKLDAVKAAGTSVNETFDADRYATRFWTAQLLPVVPRLATEISLLLPLLKTDKDSAFSTSSHALGIGNIRYFLVKGTGTLSAIRANDMAVVLSSGETIYLATEYIFGNAARDASGLIKITDFDKTTDLNNVSAALNDIIRHKVVKPLKASAEPGQKLTFAGTLELNQAHLHLDNLTLIPISVNVLP